VPLRIDKWLWAARFFKTRSLATRACELGRIEANGAQAKPSREVHAGDLLRIKNPGGEFLVEVLALSDMRGPAPVAQTLYREKERKLPPREEGFRGPKPSKRDRREMGRLRGRT
jgi:ribosome-associated heat shock protein Hsp15